MKKTADFTLLFVAFIWGATFVMVQNATSFLEPHSFNGIRFLIAFISLLIIYVLFIRKEQGVWSRNLLIAGFKIGIWLFLGYAFQTVGLLHTTPAKAGFITGLSVVLVPLFSVLLLKMKLSQNAIIGVIAATIGLYLMTVVDTASFSLGDLLILLCAVSFAMQIIMTAKVAGDYAALPLTLVQLFTVSILSFISAPIFGEDILILVNPTIMLQTEVWSALFVTAIFATALAFLAQTHFQTYTSPTRVALIFATEPVFAALTSYLWIDEKLTVASIAGCICILFGMVIAELPAKKRKIKPDFH